MLEFMSESNTVQTTSPQSTAVTFGNGWLHIEDVCAIAVSKAPAELTTDSEFWHKIDAGVTFLDQLLQDDGAIYGVTTGYGDSCTVKVPLDQVWELPIHLSRFHGCGLGEDFSYMEGRAIVAARLASLTQGYSGVSRELIERLAVYLNQDIVPRIPQEGSVGASGDLTPLSYLAGSLIGERDVYYRGQLRSSRDVLDELNL